MKFAGIQKTSLIDFPDEIATVLFTPGCNLRCPFCHNWRLILDPKGPFYSEEYVIELLESRKKYVEAVAITGGEPTIHSDIPHFLKKLKIKGFYTKLDTNGFFPYTLEKCLPYLDYVAVDVKTCLEKYGLLGAKNTDDFLKTIEILRKGSLEYEFRCTVVPTFINEKSIPKIGKLLKSTKRFALQQFVPGDTLDKSFDVKPYSNDTIAHFANLMKDYVEEIILRI